jgi:catechol 1,2-dioxygenase
MTMSTATQPSPTAAGSGANATEAFRSVQHGTADVSPERVSAVVRAVLQGVHEAIRDNDVTYP